MKRLLTLGLIGVLTLSSIGCCRPLFQRPLLGNGLFNCFDCNTYDEGGLLVEGEAVPEAADAGQ